MQLLVGAAVFFFQIMNICYIQLVKGEGILLLIAQKFSEKFH